MNRTVFLVAALALCPTLASAYEAQTYKSPKCGLSMAIPAGATATEAMGADGLCTIDVVVEGVEFHGVTEKGTATTLPQLEAWVVKYTGIAAGSWTKFDESATHVGEKANSGGKVVWAAAAKGATHSCAAWVKADAGESDADLQQFYDSLSCP